jgi:membrane dipeptidase
MPYKVFDLHCDSVFSLMDGKDLRNSVPGVHIDLPRLKAGGVGLQVFASYVPAATEVPKAFAYASERLDKIEAFAHSDESLCLVETAAELKAAMAGGKIGIMLAVENGLAIESSLEKLETLRRRKVRIMTLVHWQHLPWVASSTDEKPFVADGIDDKGRGLSNFGAQVVDAMNDLGIIPDLSHASESAFWDVIKRSKKPVIASHSCAWNICNSPRNLKDDQIKALGESGGLVGVNFYSSFLSEPFRLAYAEERKKEEPKAENVTVKVPQSIIADHIDYMLNLAGEDGVALGSDFDGITAAPEGVTGCDFYPSLEAELRTRGYTEKRIEKIFNGNFLRVLEGWDKN